MGKSGLSISAGTAESDSAANSCVDVAVADAVFQFDRLYSYTVPPQLRRYVAVGARVLVPFGRGRPRMGVVLALSAEKENLKELIDIERDSRYLDDELVELLFYLKQHTFCSYGDAVRTVLPKNSRLDVVFSEGDARMARASGSHLETAYRQSCLSVTPKLTEKQNCVYEFLESPRTFREIHDRTGVTRDVVSRLLKNGVIEAFERDKAPTAYQDYDVCRDFSLTEAQMLAYNEIRGNIEDCEKPDTTLLHGVTSSGKTLIYFQLISDVLQQGKQALLLVPEIALATQLIYRFKRLFGERVGVIHSGLSDTERQLQWQRARAGECDLIVGTRSAVFAPLSDIGLIIVDEEQEQTFLSEHNPRYHVVPLAKFRAKYHGAHLILSSATPLVETYYAAEKGRYNYVHLSERYGNMPLPSVNVIDTRSELLSGNGLCVSEYLKNEIDRRLDAGEQCLLLLNRRGYRTVSICSSCKSIIKCRNCDTALVYHKPAARYVCHYCGHSEEFRDVCEYCGGSIRHTGVGTQKIEEELRLLFPDAGILRLDMDSAGRKRSLSDKLAAFSRGDYDIIIGTQMIAKGLDFANVTLVGVLSVDQLLLAPSFRANERAFSMLTQVVGRSGRGEKAGEAVIQTVDPENPIIKLAAKQDFFSFYRGEIVSRKLHLYPPFCAISSVGLLGADEGETAAAAERFAAIIEAKVKASETSVPIRVLGPSPMRVAYVGNQFRYKITLKSRGDRAFRAMLFGAAETFYTEFKPKKVNAYINFYDDNDL